MGSTMYKKRNTHHPNTALAIFEAYRFHADRDANLRAEHQRMVECYVNHSTHVPAHTAARERRSSAHQRCKSRLCSPCVEDRRSDAADEIISAYERNLLAMASSGVAIMTFDGPPYPLAEAAHCVSHALQSWERFVGRKAIKTTVGGYVRGLELQIDPALTTITAHVRFIGLAYGNYYIEQKGGWLAAWQGTAVDGPYQLSSLREHYDGGELANLAVQNSAQEVAAVAIKPEALCELGPHGFRCCPEKLRLVRDALRRRRMIYFGGTMNR